MSMTNLMPWRRERRSSEREGEATYALDTFRQEMDRLFEDFFGRGFGLSPFWSEDLESAFSPRVDVVESDKEIHVSAELPGIDQKDIELSLDNDVLVIRGEKKSESEHRDRHTYRAERTYGTFSRAVRLPAEVDADKVDATFKNGVLTVTLPKTAVTVSKKIAIKRE